jgi:hypothetical protein
MDKIQRVLNVIQDPDDSRDHMFAERVILPPSMPVDCLLPYSPPADQGQHSCCIGEGQRSASECLQLIHSGKFTPMSEQFAYYWPRFLEHTTNQDTGATVRDGAKSAARFGLCKYTTWPLTEPFDVEPPLKAQQEALAHRLKGYHRICTIDEIRASIFLKRPVLGGFILSENYEGDDVATTGIVPMPAGNKLGGHCMVPDGYLGKHGYDLEYIRVKGSWGMFGDPKTPGHVWMTYAVFEAMQQDMWSVYTLPL